MSGTQPVLRAGDEEEMGLLKKDINKADINRMRDTKREELGDKIIMYVRSAFWVMVGAATVYYTNFFHHLFRNPHIN